MVTHAGLKNVCQAQIETFGLNPDDRILQFASLNFDASIFEIVMGLSVGASLHVIESQRLLGSALLEYLRSRQITVATLPPTALASLPVEEIPLLHTIIVAGEVCPASLVALWIEERSIFNAYGPTESTIWTTVAKCKTDGSAPPIGRPIVNAEVYILDEEMEPAPVGVNGELYLGGVGLARGYLRAPDLTAEKFVPHPFSRRPGARLYRTGDQARYAADGKIEFVGRKDQQVKLRGFRIELNEIEAVINGHESVRESVVVVSSQGHQGDQRLVAYVVRREGAEYTELGLRQYLQRKLPEYMVPAVMVALAELPLGTTGKVNRQALPAVEAARPELETKYVAPRTTVEADLARIWSEVLTVQHIGVNDNFFELGGHSLLAARVRSQIMVEFEVELPLVSIFERPTLSALADLVTQLQHHHRDGSRYRGRITQYRPAAKDFVPSLEKLSAHEIEALLIKTLTEEVQR
jgi:acyl-coenzyme A synthetase/AMP-(fatty) acid ligase